MVLAFLAAALAQAASPRVPEGFSIEKVSPEGVSFPMFAAFDDRGRLFLTESSGGDLYLELQKLVRKCVVSRLEDRDGDGRFETRRVFAEGLTPSMGLAWREGKLYVADPPDLAVLEDADGDGRAERRTVLLTGFGHKDNGSLHGITFGPDGLLYFTMGDPDGFKLKGPDGSTAEARTGGLIRCRPDGTRLEILCLGFENLVEVAFLPRGEILGTDNWFQLPTGGIRDALVHLIPGGVYPRHHDTKHAPLVRTGPPLPAVSLFPAVALSGLVRYSGASLPYYGWLFSAQHNSRKVQRHGLENAGSTFTTTDLDFVTSDDPDFHPSDVLQAPDGSLLVVDTGAWYVQHCPTGRIRNSRAPGGVWRVRATAPVDPDKKRAIENMERDWERKWALDVTRLTALLGGADGRLAAHALAVRGDRSAAPGLVEQLLDTGANVRLAAAEALATCGTAESLPALWKVLEGEVDPHFEHAVVFAIHRLADRDALEKALGRADPRVRKAALTLLSQPPHPKEALPKPAVMGGVASGDAGLRQASIRILQQRKDWAPEALGLVKDWLANETLSAEEKAGLRGCLLAFQADVAVQEGIGKALEKPGAARRLLLLEALEATALKDFPQPWRAGLLETIADPDPAVRLATVRVIALYQLAAFDELLLLVAGKRAETPAVRLESLRAVVSRRPDLPPPTLDFLVGQVAAGGESVPRLAAAEVLRRARLDEPALARILAAIRGDALVSPSVFAPQLLKARDSALEEAARSIRAGWRPSPGELGPALERLPSDAAALVERAAGEQQARIAAFERLASGGDPARGLEVFRGKKVACASCHAVGAEGGRVGPDLTRVGAVRSARDLLESILVPSSTFAQGYESYLVATVDGDVLTGLLARQTADAVVLRDASGGEIQLRRERIREMRRSEKSVMPEGLERALSEAEFRDLLAYLLSLK